jgi:S-formylglutathione hydrolase FrmB
MRVLAAVLSCAVFCAPLPAVSGQAPDALSLQLAATRAAYLKAAPALAPLTSSEEALDYAQRLQDDIERLAVPETPAGYGAAEWQDSARTTARLDEELAEQLLARKRLPLDAEPGVHARFVISSADGTWQPVALFVPSSYAKGASPLAIFLHGHPQTETELLGLRVLRDLAERTGTIVVAPYGRGYYDFHGAAAADVDDAASAALSSYRTDERRRYLIGYSMGGFSVFEVGQGRRSSWRAIMCISGALLGHDVAAVRQHMSSIPYYFVTGADDDSIPTKYTQTSAAYLDSVGVPASLYVEPRGTHRLATLRASLSAAWNDMHDGKQRGIPEGARAFAMGVLPGQPPATSAKP